MPIAGYTTAYTITPVAVVIAVQVVRYDVLITGSPDLIVPANAFHAILRTPPQLSTLSIKSPALSLIDEVQARSGGRLKLRKIMLYNDGTQSDPLDWLDFPFTDFQYDDNGRSREMTLEGRSSAIFNSFIGTKKLFGIVNERRLESGLREWQVAATNNVLHGDTVELPGTLEQVAIDEVVLQQTPTTAELTIKERDNVIIATYSGAAPQNFIFIRVAAS